jgi:hypothetical protein
MSDREIVTLPPYYGLKLPASISVRLSAHVGLGSIVKDVIFEIFLFFEVS